MGDTPTSPVIRLRRIALATRSLLPRIRSPRLRQALIGTIRLGGPLLGEGTPKSQHLLRNGFANVDCVEATILRPDAFKLDV